MARPEKITRALHSVKTAMDGKNQDAIIDLETYLLELEARGPGLPPKGRSIEIISDTYMSPDDILVYECGGWMCVKYDESSNELFTRYTYTFVKVQPVEIEDGH